MSRNHHLQKSVTKGVLWLRQYLLNRMLPRQKVVNLGLISCFFGFFIFCSLSSANVKVWCWVCAAEQLRNKKAKRAQAKVSGVAGSEKVSSTTSVSKKKQTDSRSDAFKAEGMSTCFGFLPAYIFCSLAVVSADVNVAVVYVQVNNLQTRKQKGHRPIHLLQQKMSGRKSDLWLKSQILPQTV